MGKGQTPASEPAQKDRPRRRLARRRDRLCELPEGGIAGLFSASAAGQRAAVTETAGDTLDRVMWGNGDSAPFVFHAGGLPWWGVIRGDSDDAHYTDGQNRRVVVHCLRFYQLRRASRPMGPMSRRSLMDGSAGSNGPRARSIQKRRAGQGSLAMKLPTIFRKENAAAERGPWRPGDCRRCRSRMGAGGAVARQNRCR